MHPLQKRAEWIKTMGRVFRIVIFFFVLGGLYYQLDVFIPEAWVRISARLHAFSKRSAEYLSASFKRDKQLL